jgi:hypothetical protein
MPYGKLRLAYPREFNSWRGRKLACKKKGGKWSPEWDSFKGFLVSQEPCPGPGPYTLNRINNANPDYGPGLCNWALKDEQNNNKSDNVQLVEPVTGKVWTPKKIANATGVTVNTVYKRISSFWSILELMGGRKSPALHDLWVTLDELPKPEPIGPKKVLRPIKYLPSLRQCLASSPIDDDHYEETGVRRVAHYNEICDEYDAVVDWVNTFNAGVVPMPPRPNLKFLKNFLVKMTQSAWLHASPRYLPSPSPNRPPCTPTSMILLIACLMTSTTTTTHKILRTIFAISCTTGRAYDPRI